VSAYADDAGVNAPTVIIIDEFAHINQIYEDNMFPSKLAVHKGMFLGVDATPEFRDRLIAVSDFANEIPEAQFNTNGAKILGVQVGTNIYVKNEVLTSMTSAAKCCAYITKSPLNSQTKYALLSKCANAKQWYTARNTHPELAQQALQHYDNAVDTCLADILGREVLPPEQKILRGLPKWCGGMGLTRADGPAGSIAFTKRTKLVEEFLSNDKYNLKSDLRYIQNMPTTPLCLQQSGLGLLQGDLPQTEDISITYNALTRDKHLNAVLTALNHDGSATFSTPPEEHQTISFLRTANKIICLSMLVKIVKESMVEVTEENIEHLHAHPDHSKLSIDDTNYVMLNKSVVKAKLAWLVSGISTPESKSGPAGHKVSTWNTGGLQLDWTGKAYGDYPLMSNEIFRSYLCSRLYIPLSDTPLLCNTDNHGVPTDDRPAINIRDTPLHGLLCKGVGQPAHGTRRHTQILRHMEHTITRIIEKAPNDVEYNGLPIGPPETRAVVTGAEDKFYHNGREIIADLVIQLHKNTNHECRVLIDLTVREPHASNFVNHKTAKLSQGQAAAGGISDKAARYRQILNDNTKLYTFSLESNGYVSPSSHDLLSLLSDFNAPEGTLFALQRKIAGAIAVRNGEAIAQKYRDSYWDRQDNGNYNNVHNNHNGVHHAQEAGNH